ncbi:MAG: outer membrane beta-barrel protein [Candidatus Kapaibacterium sp.]
MYKSIKFFLIAAAFMLAPAFGLHAQVDIGFHLGLSTPNDQVNDIYNRDRFEDNDSARNFVRDGTKAGYHIGMKARVSLTDNVLFVGSIAWNKFPQTDIYVTDPETGEVLTTLKSSQNIIPIGAGINFYLLRSFIGVYATGDLTYNYITSSVDYESEGIPIPLSSSPTDNRVGFGLGAGADLDLGLLTINLEGKYNQANLIGKESDEEAKAYYTLTLGIYF